uniref:Uncharacterized protein n=1 Tax=Schizaphis graminum TaxID=13262 RepID=A0A2S2P276_SCHGA
MDVNTLLQPNRLSIFSLGYFLGPDYTDNERKLAGKQGEIIFKHFGVIPGDFDVPGCHCGEPLYRVADASRKLICGWLKQIRLQSNKNGHGVVNHTINFVEPPKNLPPIWVPAGRFSPECLEKQWQDAIPGTGQYGTDSIPYPTHRAFVA